MNPGSRTSCTQQSSDYTASWSRLSDDRSNVFEPRDAVRWNFACPPKGLAEAYQDMASAISQTLSNQCSFSRRFRRFFTNSRILLNCSTQATSKELTANAG